MFLTSRFAKFFRFRIVFYTVSADGSVGVAAAIHMGSAAAMVAAKIGLGR